MAKHNPQSRSQFDENMKGLEDFDEQTLLDRLNKTIVTVELDNSYNTDQKLKIYSLISTLSNSEGKQRKKIARKISRALK